MILLRAGFAAIVLGVPTILTYLYGLVGMLFILTNTMLFTILFCIVAFVVVQIIQWVLTGDCDL